ADRIVIQADPAAPPGSVVVTPGTARCTHAALRFRRSKFVTLRGLTITGAGGQAVSLLGGHNQNLAIHLERLRIVGNGSGSCDGGIAIGRGNPHTLITNTLIYGNGRNGLVTLGADAPTPGLLSPARGRGTDPRTLGLPASRTALLEADYSGVSGARPKNGTSAPEPRFDIGALEASAPDHHAPTVIFVEPPANAHVRRTVTVRAHAADTASGVTGFGLRVDSQALSATLMPTPPPPASSVTAAAAMTTTSLPDGAHTLRATATDRAGNSATTARVVIVDNTPPTAQITNGPGGPAQATTATLTFTGADNLTRLASLQFAWRLDSGP